MSVDIQLLTSPDEFVEIRDQWDALVDRSVYPNFFLRAEWMLAWWKWFGRRLGTFHVLLLRDSDRLIGGLPLFRQRGGRLKFLGFDGIACPEYLGLVVEPERMETVADRFTKYFAGDRTWSELFFEDYALDDPGTVRFVELLRQRFPGWERAGEPRAYIPLSGTYEDYLKTRNSKNRYKKRRELRDAEESYHARLVEPEIGKMDDWFPKIQRLSNCSIGRRAFPPLLREDFSGMFRDLLPRLLSSGEARVFLLYYGEMPASFLFGFFYRGRFSDYQTGFDPALPGRAGSTILQMILMKLCGEGTREFDFLRGAEEYKQYWTETCRETKTVAVFRRRHAGYFRRIVVENVLRPVWRKLKAFRVRFLKPKPTEKES